MSTHKHISIICVVAVVLSLLITVAFMNGEELGIPVASTLMGYEDRLFDTSQVHTIDIVMDDWNSFIETCENEEYMACSVVIDGEAYKNVGIRAKGNTSLRTVSSLGSDRYSFKIEFDQYDSGKSYHGLDKLSLNNLIQDSTMMKDYLTYRMMGEFGAAAPLCSYVYITVNGEDWGLYLAVEGVEESFLQRNYGSDYGELYKPDSMNMGGGRGNGREFDFDELIGELPEAETTMNPAETSGNRSSVETDSKETGGVDDETPKHFGGMGQMPGDRMHDGFPNEGDGTPFGEAPAFDEMTPPDGMKIPGGFGGGGLGSDDAKLQYIDDDPESYSTIFFSAKTDITEADQARLIASLKSLSAGERIEEVVDIDAVLRYFVVHNFVVNGDSYTGSMIHNYYLYEEDGQMAMIPWDYNLAFGTFQGGSASGTVNDPIDTPLSIGNGDRPMIDWIFDSEEYTELYHRYFSEFLESTDFAALIDTTAEQIASYVEKDPSKFYTFEEFEAGVTSLKQFCLLREKSILGQLNGVIGSTSATQTEDTLIDVGELTISAMGTMNMGRDDMGGGHGGMFEHPTDGVAANAETSGTVERPKPPADPTADKDGDSPENAPTPQPTDGKVPEGMHRPNGGSMDEREQHMTPLATTADPASAIWTIVSCGILLVGIVFAFCYKRRR